MSAELFNQVIKSRNYTKYLEIGLSSLSTFSNIYCEKLCGVDIGTYTITETEDHTFIASLNCDPIKFKKGVAVHQETTSDKFFENCNETYDIIFIDGDHEHTQVLKDIENSIRCLSPNGIIFVHDTKPHTELMQRTPMPHHTELCERGLWTGDGWKAIAKFRNVNKNFTVKTLDVELGLTIIERGEGNLIEIPEELTYDWYLTNQDYVLNLVPYRYITGL